MIVSSIIKVIEIIDIKFSVLLTADDKFKVILKDFEDEINFEDLIEKIYETSIIKRYKSNLAKSVKTALNYPEYSRRENTLFLIFPDSLDESILDFNYWNDNILNDTKNSFVFFIEKKTLKLKNKNEKNI